MTEGIFTVAGNRSLAKNVYEMELTGDTRQIIRPGQFVNIKLDGLYLRRPLSVCDVQGERLTVIYKTVGQGTEAMARLDPGAKLSVLTGLGNGFDISKAGDSPALFGGGTGVSAMYMLAKTLAALGKRVQVVLGFREKSEVFYEREFQALGCQLSLCTVAGDYGIMGLVTDAMPESYSYFYACGPEPMLRAICQKSVSEGQMSFEKRMGCGFGACMGCTCETLTGYKRICRDGPVLEKGEVLWGD